MSNKDLDSHNPENELDQIDEFGEKQNPNDRDSVYEDHDDSDQLSNEDLTDSNSDLDFTEASDSDAEKHESVVLDTFDEQVEASNSSPNEASERVAVIHKKSGKRKIVTAIALGLFATIGAGTFLVATGIISIGGSSNAHQASITAGMSSSLQGNAQSNTVVSGANSDESKPLDLDDLLGMPSSSSATEAGRSNSDVENMANSNQSSVDSTALSPEDSHHLTVQQNNSIASIVESMVGQLDDIAERINVVEEKFSDDLSAVDQRIIDVEARMEAALVEIESMVASGIASVKSSASGSGQRSTSRRNLPVSAVNGIHTVVSGDTVTNIASRYNLSAAELVRNNGISNPDLIPIGITLRVDGNSASDEMTRRISAITRTPASVAANSNAARDVVAEPEKIVSINPDSGAAIDGWNIAGMSPERVVLVNGGGVFITARIGDTISALGVIKAINMNNGTVLTSAGIISN